MFRSAHVAIFVGWGYFGAVNDKRPARARLGALVVWDLEHAVRRRGGPGLVVLVLGGARCGADLIARKALGAAVRGGARIRDGVVQGGLDVAGQHAHRQHDEEEGGVLGEDHRRTESRGYGTRRPVFIELRGGRGLYVGVRGQDGSPD